MFKRFIRKLTPVGRLLMLLAACLPVATQAQTGGYYWFDREPEMHPFMPGVFEIDANGLSDGFHTLHVVAEADGVQSAPASRFFLKIPSVAVGQECTARIEIDGTPTTCVDFSLGDNGIAHIDLDMDQIPPGLHQLRMIVVNPSGSIFGIRDEMFIKVPSRSQFARMRGFYAVDGIPQGELALTPSGNVYHMDCDLSALPTGVHSVTAFLASPDGFATPVRTAWFIKTPLGGEGVKSYDYWINDNNATLRHVDLERVANPFSLLSMLEVDPQPFRSTQYSFVIEDGVPKVYASNDFMIRFYDPESRFTMHSGTYMDVRVSRSVENIAPLTDNARNNLTGIRENEITWRSFEGEIGDSISLRLDRGGMIEVYSPSGKEIGKLSGADATHRYVTHTINEQGMYYVGVHDIAGNDKTTANVDFAHVGKFAMLENSPEKSSGEDMLYVKVFGNGFTNLKSLSLKSGDTQRAATDWTIEDNYALIAYFNLDEEPLAVGDYKLVGVFEDSEKGCEETVTSVGSVTIEPREPGEITAEIEISRIPATPFDVMITVTNNGNTGEWCVPVNFAVRDSRPGNLVGLMNFGILNPEQNDLTIQYETDNLLGSGYSGVYLPAFIPYLAPYESKTYTLGLVTEPHDMIHLRAWTGEPLSREARWLAETDYAIPDGYVAFRGTHLTLIDMACCMESYRKLNSGTAGSVMRAPVTADEMVEFIQDGTEAVYDLEASGNARSNVLHLVRRLKYASRVSGRESQIVLEARIGDSKINLDKYRYLVADQKAVEDHPIYKQMMQDMKCLRVAEELLAAGTTPDGVLGFFESCYHWFRAGNYWLASRIPPASRPKKDTGDVTVGSLQSGDPNDMHGYLSPSGSNFIGKSVKTLGYSIEFENDPAIATASASRIVVTNRLDRNLFDLESMRPDKWIMGDRQVDLPHDRSFVKTLDMRPEINSIAELSYNFDSGTGMATWSIRTLDPMKLEESRWAEDGVLPVNDDTGRGIGYLTYTVDLADGLADGTQIDNKATIIFDDNAPIDTPVWTNIIDDSQPESEIVEMSTEDDMTFEFTVTGSDTGAGIWHYDLYLLPAGSTDWQLVKTGIEEDRFTYTSPTTLEGADFLIIAVDMAGNRQDEAELKILLGDSDRNGVVDANDVVVIRNHYTGKATAPALRNADVTRDSKIDAQDATSTRIIYLGPKKSTSNVNRLRRSKK